MHTKPPNFHRKSDSNHIIVKEPYLSRVKGENDYVSLKKSERGKCVSLEKKNTNRN